VRDGDHQLGDIVPDWTPLMTVGNDNHPQINWRALRSPESCLLLVGCIAADAGVGVSIVVPLIVVGLSISSLLKYLSIWPIAERVGAQRDWWQAVAFSLLGNLVVACAVCIAGVVFRWLWWA
jgi:hypothetical protein